MPPVNQPMHQSTHPNDSPLNSTDALLPFSTFQELNNYFDLFMNEINSLVRDTEHPNMDFSRLKLLITFVMKIVARVLTEHHK